VSHRIVDADGIAVTTPMTAYQLGRLLGRPEQTVASWVRRGTAPRRTRLSPGRYVYLPADVEAWLDGTHGILPRTYTRRVR
jgi:predicted DNA-binding transcriptional regulator AlpA